MDQKERKYKLNHPDQNLTFWGNIKKYLKGYCEVSTIQGLKYIVKDGASPIERAWWILIFILCIGGCSYMIFKVIDKWLTTPILVNIATQESPIHVVPFPAVTICPETKISRNCLNYTETLIKRRKGNALDVDFEENLKFDYMSLLCKPDNHQGLVDIIKDELTKLNENVDSEEEINIRESIKLDDYSEFLDKCKSVDINLSYCKWMGEEMDCKDILAPVLTDEGLCYSFNMFDVRDIYSDINTMVYYNESKRDPNWYPDSGYLKPKGKTDYPRRAYLNGAKNALLVAFLTKKSDIYYTCRDFALQGLRVSLHMPSRIPRPSQIFFSVGLDRLTSVSVIPHLTLTTPKIKEYKPEDRNCYFCHERKLKYFKEYSQANCNMECWTNYTIQYCGCTHFYMPRDANTSICGLEKRFCLEDARLNYPINLLRERLNLKQENEKFAKEKCDCLPICIDLHYNAEISSGKWYFSEDLDWITNEGYHASAVKVFFKNNYFLATEKSELYGISDFISNIGGILGLFTGFSLFSLAEIIYFLVIKIIENYRRYGYWAGERVQEV